MEALQHNTTPYLYPVLVKLCFFFCREEGSSASDIKKKIQGVQQVRTSISSRVSVRTLSQNSLNHKEDISEVLSDFNCVWCEGQYTRCLHIMCVNLLCTVYSQLEGTPLAEGTHSAPWTVPSTQCTRSSWTSKTPKYRIPNIWFGYEQMCRK